LPAWHAGEVTTSVLLPHRRGQLPGVRVVVDALVAHYQLNAARASTCQIRASWHCETLKRR
jgi:hypothetical protein